MKKKVRLCAFLMAACLFASILYPYSPQMQVFATEENTQPNADTTLGEQFEVDGVRYKEVATGKVQLTEWKNASGVITIPEQISYNEKDYQVVSIGDSVFANNESITEVVFPETVTSIGMGAFKQCSGLKKAKFPSSLTSIGKDAFNRCTSLTEADLPSNLSTIGENAFVYCALAGNLVIPTSVTTMGDCSFQFTKFTSIEIQNPDITYGSSVFSYNKELLHITLPDGLTALPENFLDNCSKLAEITLPEGLVELKPSVFRGCTSLTEITLPSSVQILGHSVFSGCTGLQEVTIPNGVTTTNACLFQKCSNNLVVNLPDSITTIDPRTFEGTAVTVNCTNRQVAVLVSGTGVENVKLNGDVFIPPETKFETSDFTFSVIDDENKRVRLGRYKNKETVENVQIPETVTSPSSGITYTITEIDKDAFYLRSNITGNVQIPDAVTKIGSSAFYNCSAMTGINLPESLESIGGLAFSGCTSLTGTLCIPESCIELPERTFFNCESLTEVIFPETLVQIGLNAFYHCTGLTSVKLPDSLLTIMGSAFEGCSGLTSVTLPQNLQIIPESAFEGCTGLIETLILPDSITEIHTGAFGGCENLSRIHLGNGVNVVQTGAFPENIMLTTYSPTVQQLLLENTTQTGETHPMLLWDGTTDIPAGTTITVMDTIKISGNRTIGENVKLSIAQGAKITIAKDAVLTIEEGANLISASDTQIEVNGTLTNNGTISGEGTLNIKDGTISGNGTVNVDIDKILLTSDMIADIEDETYTGTALKPEPEVSITMGGKKLVFEKEIDFTYHYEKNTNPGQAELTVTPRENGRLLGEPVTKKFVIHKANQDSPACHLSFVLNKDQSTYTAEIETADGAEYSFDGTNWSDSNKKDDCLPVTSYTAYIRFKETETHNASPAAQTKKTTGKANQEAPECSLTFTKNEDGKTYTAEIGAVEGAEYSFDGLNWSENNKKDVLPDVCVTAFIRRKETNTHNASPFAYIAKYIKKADQEAPECSLTFTLNKDEKTYTAQIAAVEGAEYSFDGINWSDSNKKEDCLPATSYTAYIRFKETSTHNASPAAQVKKTTEKLNQEAPECNLTFTKNEDGKTYTAEISAVEGAEYSFDGINWSDSNKKEDCLPETSYTVFIRMKETNTHNASPAANTTKTSPKPEQGTGTILKAPVIEKLQANAYKAGIYMNITIQKTVDADKYEVYRIVGTKTTKIGTTASGKNTIQDKKPVKSAKYYAIAIGKDGKTTSKAGAKKSVELADTTRITKISSTTAQIKVTWKKLSKATQYAVYRSTKKNSGYTKIKTVSKNNASYTDKSVKKNTIYYYKVAVITSTQPSLLSSTSKAVKLQSLALSAPTISKLKAKAYNTGVYMDITVKAVSGADKYTIYRVVGKNTKKIGTTASKKTTIQDKNPVKTAKYYAIAISKDGKIKSKAGKTKSITLATATKITKVSSTSKGIKVTWKKSKSAVNYVLYRSTKKNSGYTKLTTVSKKKLSFIDKKAKNKKSYYYKIAVVTKTQSSLLSSPSKRIKR